MKAPILPHVLWAAAAACAFAIGIYIGSTFGAETSAKESVRLHSAQLSDATSRQSIPNDREPTRGARAATLTIEEVRSRAFAMEVEPKNRIERMRQFLDLVPYVTRENWRQVLDGFETAKRARGGGSSERYQMMLEHVAAVVGAEALEDALTPEKAADSSRFHTMLKAWCQADAKASTVWYQAQPAEIQRRYMGHFITGVSRADPQTALEFTFRQSENFYAGGTTTAVVNNAVVLYGAMGTDELFRSMSSRADIPKRAKEVFFTAVTNAALPVLNNAKDPAMEVLNWYGNHVGHDYVSADQSTRIIGQAANSNPEAVMAWLEMQSDTLSSPYAARAYSATAGELQKQSPQQLFAWLAAHPTHPQRDDVLHGAVDTLAQAGDFNGALQMVNAISDSEKRTALRNAVQNRMQQQAK